MQILKTSFLYGVTRTYCPSAPKISTSITNINDGTQRYIATPSVRVVLLIGTSLHKTCISLSKTLWLDGDGGVMIKVPRFFFEEQTKCLGKRRKAEEKTRLKNISQNSRYAYFLLLSEIQRIT